MFLFESAARPCQIHNRQQQTSNLYESSSHPAASNSVNSNEMSTNWLAVLAKCRYEPNIIPYLLACLRVFICLLPQTGYLHPDEFFQSTDIVGGTYFNSYIEPTWEFTTDRPIRCMLIPTILNKIAFRLASLIQSRPSAYLLIVAPRVVYTLLSFIIDICLVKLCHYYSTRGQWYLPVSIVFQTSFICLACLTRTFSNVPETVIFALLLVVVCQTIRPTFRILFTTQNRTVSINQRAKKSQQILSSILVGFLTTLGIFNRPTFPCFALMPLVYWLVESWKRNSHKVSLTIQRAVIPLITTTILTALLLSAFDTYYYNGVEVFHQLLASFTSGDIDAFIKQVKSTWILTPYNFIAFNSNSRNLVQFGLHPPYMHMLVNLPFAFNLLAFMFYAKLISLMMGSNAYRLLFSAHRVYALMLITTLVSTVLLSIIPHQEFRFLMPIIIPLTCVFAYNIYSSNRLLLLWVISNCILVLFYSHVHQAGVTRACLDLDSILKTHVSADRQTRTVDVIATKSYRMPTYQWNIPASTDWFRFIPFDDQNSIEETAESAIKLVLRNLADSNQVQHDIFFILHRLYEEKLIEKVTEHLPLNISHKFHTMNRYWPHFSGEDLSDSLRCIRQQGLRCIRRAFELSLIHLELDSTGMIMK